MSNWTSTYLDLLDDLRNADPDRSVFGSEYHQYKLNPPICQSQLSDVETRYNCQFPTEYRRYLLEIADGGAGPGLGIYSLAKALELFDSRRDFPFESEYAFYPPGNGRYSWDDMNSGTLVHSHYGCSMFALLVVRGVSASQIWYDGEDRCKPLATSFSKWVLNWVASALDRVRAQDGG